MKRLYVKPELVSIDQPCGVYVPASWIETVVGAAVSGAVGALVPGPAIPG